MNMKDVLHNFPLHNFLHKKSLVNYGMIDSQVNFPLLRMHVKYLYTFKFSMKVDFPTVMLFACSIASWKQKWQEQEQRNSLMKCKCWWFMTWVILPTGGPITFSQPQDFITTLINTYVRADENIKAWNIKPTLKSVR